MTREPTQIDLDRRILWLAGGFIILGLLLKLILMQLAPVHWDSNYYLNIGSNFIERGEITPYMWRLGADTHIIAGSGAGYGILLLTYWFKVFGLSLLSGYAFMYLIGLLSLVVVYYVARDWWGGRIAGIGAVVFMALDGTFASHFYIRMDAPAILVYLLILWLHLRAVRSGRKGLHFAVGVALILAAEIHMLALVYIGAISLYHFLEEVQRIRQQRQFWQVTPAVYYFAGLLLAGIIYLLVHVAPDPKAYFIISHECPACDPSILLREIRRYVLWIGWYGVEALLFIIAVALAWIRRTQADRHYVILAVGFFIGLTITSPPGGVPYVTHALPLICIGVGGAWMNGTDERVPFNSQRLFLGIVIASYLFLVLFVNLIMESTGFGRPERPSVDVSYVREYVPHDTVVMGDPPLFHDLLNYDRFLSYRDGDRYGIELRNEDYPTFWERERPQVFVGEPKPDDSEWWAYMHAHDFRQVRDDIWIAGDLLESISAAYPVPALTFRANSSRLDFGECTTLEWSVANSDTVELNDEAVKPAGEVDVCPPITTDYTLSVYWVGGIQTKTITVQIK
jgi:hypothetical protein